MSIVVGSRCSVCLPIFLFVDVVLCKTVLTNCLLNAVALCWGVIDGLPLIAMMTLGVDGVFFSVQSFYRVPQGVRIFFMIIDYVALATHREI